MRGSPLNLTSASKEQLLATEKTLLAEYADIQAKNLNLDLTRGKPSTEQLSLSNGLEDTIKGDFFTKEGVDVRNYGGLNGIPGARALGAALMLLPPENVLAGGNASLTLMHQTASIAFHDGLNGPDSASPNVLPAPQESSGNRTRHNM